MAFTCPKDTKHPLRIEYPANEQERIVYCTVCEEHYDLCPAINYMDPCIYAKDHPGGHQDATGQAWIDAPLTHGKTTTIGSEHEPPRAPSRSDQAFPSSSR